MKKVSKQIKVDGKNGRIVVEFGINKTNHSYFSITGTVYSSAKSELDRYHVTGGAIHDEIEKYFPGEYSDLIALRLSDVGGWPMYAVENGFYHYSSGNYSAVKDLLRIDDTEFETLTRKLQNAVHSKEVFIAYCEEQRQRWSNEAKAAIEKHNLLIPA